MRSASSRTCASVFSERARRVLRPRSVSARVLLLYGCLLAGTTRVRAAELDVDVAANPDFIYSTSDVVQAVLDDKLRFGAGWALLGDTRGTRHGARALGGVDFNGVDIAAIVSWAPAQEGRGWLAAELEMDDEIAIDDRVALTLHAESAARRADLATSAGGVITAGQLHAAALATLVADGRWRVGALGAASLYDVDLARRGVRQSDAGVLVSIAGRPERWAFGVRGGRRFGDSLLVELGLTGVAFADGTGAACVPRVSVRAHPLRWLTMELTGELLVLATTSLVGGLAVEVTP